MFREKQIEAIIKKKLPNLSFGKGGCGLGLNIFVCFSFCFLFCFLSSFFPFPVPVHKRDIKWQFGSF